MEIIIDHNSDEIRFNNIKFHINGRVNYFQTIIVELVNAIAECQAHYPGNGLGVQISKIDEENQTTIGDY